jgi:predicted membrane channel-forming protein YqfA (hemolysin III family)
MPSKRSEGSAELKARLEVVKELTNLFKFERMVYLCVTIISLIMILFSVGLLIYRKQAGSVELTLMFGSSGLITYSASRLLHMWDEALKRIVPQ